MCGTPRYVSPEVANCSGHSFGVDHWALGVLAYEMIAGYHPFDQWENERDGFLFAAIVEDDFEPLPEEVNPLAKDFISLLLMKEPTKRLGYVDAKHFHDIVCENERSPLLDHPWLAEIDVVSMRRKELEAPWKPKLFDGRDSSFFDDWSHLESVVRPSYNLLSSKDLSLFNDLDLT